MKLVDRETFVYLDVPQVVSRLPTGGAGGDGGHIPRPPGLALLDGPVDRHGATGEVLQLFDAGLAPEVGRSGEGRVGVGAPA